MNDWKECLENSVKNITPDEERAKSLVETANQRIKVIKEINKDNINFVFEDYYTSIMELIQASSFKRGYNILNHVCLSYYLKEILKRDDLKILFDDLRYKRNSLTYYGKRMDFQTAKETIQKSKRVFNALKTIFETN